MLTPSRLRLASSGASPSESRRRKARRDGFWPRPACTEAEPQRRGSSIKTPAVLSAVIQLGNCLNLTETEPLALVKDAHEAYLQFCAASGSPVLENRGTALQVRFLDCAVIETVHQFRQEEGNQPFDTVCGFFVEGRALYPGAGFRELDHIQVCVRSSKQIIGYFLPRST